MKKAEFKKWILPLCSLDLLDGFRNNDNIFLLPGEFKGAKKYLSGNCVLTYWDEGSEIYKWNLIDNTGVEVIIHERRHGYYDNKKLKYNMIKFNSVDNERIISLAKKAQLPVEVDLETIKNSLSA